MNEKSENFLKDAPRFSVIIPAFNRVNGFVKALLSVTRQNYPYFEAVVIDDASTPSLLENFENTVGGDRRFRYYRLPKNKGAAAARNYGVKRTKEEWLAFLDSDDEWHENKLQRMAEAIRKNPNDVFFESDSQWIRHGKKVEKPRAYLQESGDVFLKNLERCIIAASSVVIHRETFEEAEEFDENLPICEDYALWLRVTLLFPLHFVKEKLVTRYEGGEEQLSHRYKAIERFRLTAIQHCEAFFRKFSRNYYFRAAYINHPAMKAFPARKKMPQTSDNAIQQHYHNILKNKARTFHYHKILRKKNAITFFSERKKHLRVEKRRKALILANGSKKRGKWWRWMQYSMVAVKAKIV